MRRLRLSVLAVPLQVGLLALVPTAASAASLKVILDSSFGTRSGLGRDRQAHQDVDRLVEYGNLLALVADGAF